jgi:hydroxymethylglutaryl-CoA synthase
MKSFGISDLAFHIPNCTVRLEDMMAWRSGQGDEVSRLRRSTEFTGQKHMRVPDWYEDTVTMVAEATRTLLERNGRVAPGDIRYYACGTETPQDESKPIVSYCQGLVEVSGGRVGPRAAVYDLKHACASGTYAMFSVLNTMCVESLAGSTSAGIAAMGDISSYRRGSTAELTQGAGAVAALVEENPRLLAIDLGVTGVWGESVDDFFRSVGQRHASVRGRYSMKCYQEALMGAYGDYKHRALESGLLRRAEGGHFLDNFDYAVLHAPFHSMPAMAMEELLVQVRSMTSEEAAAEVARLHLRDGLNFIRSTGNLYTGSLYLCLGDLLTTEYRRIGEAVEGKRILLASYGSGNTMVVFGAVVVPGAGEVIRRMGVARAVEAQAEFISPDLYDELARLDKFSSADFAATDLRARRPIPTGKYCLDEIREDGYRKYGHR